MTQPAVPPTIVRALCQKRAEEGGCGDARQTARNDDIIFLVD